MFVEFIVNKNKQVLLHKFQTQQIFENAFILLFAQKQRAQLNAHKFQTIVRNILFYNSNMDANILKHRRFISDCLKFFNLNVVNKLIITLNNL